MGVPEWECQNVLRSCCCTADGVMLWRMQCSRGAGRGSRRDVHHMANSPTIAGRQARQRAEGGTFISDCLNTYGVPGQHGENRPSQVDHDRDHLPVLGLVELPFSRAQRFLYRSAMLQVQVLYLSFCHLGASGCAHRPSGAEVRQLAVPATHDGVIQVIIRDVNCSCSRFNAASSHALGARVGCPVC